MERAGAAESEAMFRRIWEWLLMFLGLGLGVNRGRRGGTISASIALSNNSISEGASVGTTIGTLSVANGTGTYTFTEVTDADNVFAISGANLNTSAALNYDAPGGTSHDITVQADNGVDTPITRTFTINVTNVYEAAAPSDISLSSSTVATGSSSSGTISAPAMGWTLDSASGVPSGLTLDLVARTWSWDGTGALGVDTITFTQTGDSASSPYSNTFDLTVSAINNVLLADNGDYFTTNSGDYLEAA